MAETSFAGDIHLFQAIELAEAKRCGKCGRVLPLSDFPIKRGVHESPCRPCRRAVNRAYNHTQRDDATTRAYQAATKAFRATPEGKAKRQAERAKAAAKKGREYTPGPPGAGRGWGIKIAHAKRRLSPDEAARRAQAKAERAKAREIERAAKPWLDRSLTRAQAWQLRYRLDPAFALASRMRSQAKRRAAGLRLTKYVRGAAQRGKGSSRYEQFLGYTFADLHRHVERQFTKRMTWARFCAGEIHIDHIIPLSKFDMTDVDQVRAAWAMTNLRPMWAKENRQKHDKRTLLL